MRASDPPAAFESALPDVLGPGLDVVFCGINPGIRSAAAGMHFANPRNDFWRLLADSGLTPRLRGDLRRADFAGAAERLGRIAHELRPRFIAFVGKAAYEGAFRERARHGLQERRLAETRLFVLPSTSPANAAVPYEERLRWFRALAGLAGRG